MSDSYDDGKLRYPPDPSKASFGWWMMHTLGKRAVDDAGKQAFINYLNLLAQEFPCGKCRGHINEYLSTHPFSDLAGLGELQMLKWSWLFHNAVNTRLGKPYVTWEDCLEMFPPHVTLAPCTNCGGNASHGVSSSAQPVTLADKQKIVQGYFMRK